jgi:thioredoxin-like negative regulator of GroEL
LEKALEENPRDAEVIINLIEIMIMQEEYKEAQSYIKHYTSQSSLDYLDRDQKRYDDKIAMFEIYLKNHLSSGTKNVATK